jgi:hypothetical protein
MISVEDYDDSSLSPRQDPHNNSLTHSSSVLDYILSKDSSSPSNLIGIGPHPNYEEICTELINLQTLIRDTITIWRKINITHLQNQFHENVIEITEKREEYLKKRKLLASSLRKFTQEALHENTSLSIAEIQQECTQIIEKFKSDFDFLSSMCKQSERFYLDLYKILREATDPVIALSDSSVLSYQVVTTLQTTEDLLKKLTLELSKKDKELSELRQQQQQQISSTSSSSSSNRLNQMSDEKHYQEKLQLELVEIKSNYENEFKKREQLLRDSLEKKYYELISESDQVIARKEFENQQLNDSLSELKQFAMQSQEEHELYLLEAEKRQRIETKLQTLTVEISKVIEEKEALSSQLELLESELQSFQKVSKEEKLAMEFQIQSTEEDLQRVRQEKIELEEQLTRCPPIDFKNLMETLGLVDDQQSPLAAPQENSENIPSWPMIEKYLQGVIRKYQHLISEFQNEKKEFEIQERQLEEENGIMREQIDKSNEAILKLERDLSDAYSSIEAGKALLKCHTIINEKNRTMSAGGLESGGSDTSASGSGSGGGVPGSTNNTILQGLLSQRDRMMKLAREKETEVNSLQIQMKDLQKNLNQLQQENLQLYQRIRTVRIGQQQQQQRIIPAPLPFSSSSSSSSGTASGSQGGSRNEEKRDPGNDDGDDIERKYQSQYESQLDLSHHLLYEYDKQTLFSQLNPAEKSFISLIQFLIQDSFRRHSSMLCLLLVALVLLCDLARIVIVSESPLEGEYGDGMSLISELQSAGEEEEWETPHLDNMA